MKEKVVFLKALERYRSSVSILKKGYVQEAYRIAQLSRSFLANIAVDEITSVDIASYRDMRLSSKNAKTGTNISPATVRLELSLMSNIFDICRIEWGYCDSNPVSNVRKPKLPPGRERRISPREEKKILRFCHTYSNPELYSIFVLAIETAMRQGEILNLSWEHVNLKTRVAHLPQTKNGSKRDVPLSLRAREALTRLGTKLEGRIFTYKNTGLKSVWRLMMNTLQIHDLHFHDARHEAASRFFEMGTMDVMEIAAITGHKSLAMLKRYTHLSAQKLVKKLDGPKNRSQQTMLDLMLPYPAEVTHGTPGTTTIKLLDFKNLAVSADTFDKACEEASKALLQRIAIMAIKRIPIPQPDQYLHNVNRDQIHMINPVIDLDELEELQETETFAT
jgi:integrase